jgi:cytochrome P450
MDSETLLARISDYANRPDPYPLYAELREAGPVVWQADGSCLIGTYHEIAALLHDPRMSADPRSRTSPAPSEEPGRLPFLRLDDPEHHRLRTLTMRPFGPPHSPGRVDAMRGEIARITDELIEALRDREQIDVVDDFAYPLPITVICRLMGVPREDESLFQGWTDAIVASADIGPEEDTTERDKAGLQGQQEMGRYLINLAEQRRGRPTGDMLSDLINEPDPALRLSVEELAQTTILLFIAGHETTVNLITNGVLTLLRRPDQLDRLRRDPGLLSRAVEELLRYEPPVHMRERFPLADIDVAGTTIPQGTSVVLALASGSRDPKRFHEPDRFDPTRPDNEHFGFGSGIHFCYGAPLARIEAETALGALLPRLATARLVQDPPPYRQNAMLRGPRHLPVQLPTG